MSEMFFEGVELMLVGMVVVFSLLSLLVLAVKGMSFIVLSIEGPAVVDAPPAPGLPDDEGEVLAAVTAAVHAYRKSAKH